MMIIMMMMIISIIIIITIIIIVIIIIMFLLFFFMKKINMDDQQARRGWMGWMNTVMILIAAYDSGRMVYAWRWRPILYYLVLFGVVCWKAGDSCGIPSNGTCSSQEWKSTSSQTRWSHLTGLKFVESSLIMMYHRRFCSKNQLLDSFSGTLTRHLLTFWAFSI